MPAEAGVFRKQGLEVARLLDAIAEARDARADKLRANHRPLRVAIVAPQVVDPVGMDVTGEHHRVGHSPLLAKLQQLLPLCEVARPLVHREPFLGPGHAVDNAHHHLLGKHVPTGRRGDQAGGQPASLGVAQEGVARRGRLAVERNLLVAIGLIAAVLAGVEHEKLRQPAKATATVEPHVRALGKALPPQRHHLVVGLVGIGPSQQKLRRIDALFFGDARGVVVVKLMIVPGDHPWASRVHLLQERIAAVGGVPAAVVGERGQLRLVVVQPHAALSRLLVDVVAEVKHQIGRLLGHVAIRREVARLIVLAAGKGKPQRFGSRRCCRHRAGAADRALRVAAAEAVGIPPPRLQAFHLDMHRVGQLRHRDSCASLDDVLKRIIRGNFPDDIDRLRPHAPVGIKRLRSEPRPEHHAVGRGVTRRHAKAEGVGSKATCGTARHGPLSQHRRRREAARISQKPPPVEAALIAQSMPQLAGGKTGKRQGRHDKLQRNIGPLLPRHRRRSSRREWLGSAAHEVEVVMLAAWGYLHGQLTLAVVL